MLSPRPFIFKQFIHSNPLGFTESSRVSRPILALDFSKLELHVKLRPPWRLGCDRLAE